MITYEFSEEQEMLRQSVREWAAKNLTPRVQEMEKNKEIPHDLIKSMAKMELLCPTVAPEYGGSGFDAVTAGIVGEELGRADYTASTAVFYLVQASWAYLFDKYGTHECKSKYIPPATKGDAFIGIATTEPGIGSDLANMVTTITPNGNRYIVNGEKNYISGVREVKQYGGGHVTIARQNLQAGTRGMTLFFLPLGLPGIDITEDEEMGREAISTGGFHISNVEIPKENIIGKEEKGFYIVHEGYEFARAIIACVCCGAAMKSLENGISYIKERNAFGRPIGKYEGIQFPLAEHYTKISMLRDLSYKALHMIDLEKEGKASRMEVSKTVAMAKMICATWAMQAIDDVMQWQGAFGYNKECPDQAAYRAVRSFTLAEGSKEIMKTIVARELLGKEFITYR
ncbi:MAG: acyl-CoA/acyl-ACP dehydrogenase [Chitinispirillaceae bacterium]|nr:acyl-CoA/acyl-ACP dehydrogenase [Chitinispirillaceae bacterium]